MGHVWSDTNKFAKWLEVELAATETLAEAGQVPKDAAAAIRARAKIDVAQIHQLEARVKHDVIAFTMAVGESIGDPDAARWLHYGMTSNDVVDTAQALQIRDASRHGNGRADLPETRIKSRSRGVASHPARSPRALSQLPGAHRRHARKNRSRNSASPAHRSP